MRGSRSTSEHLEALQRTNSLQIIDTPVDPNLELPEIHRRVVAQGGPALLFQNVIGSSFPVATNLFGSKQRLQLALGCDPSELLTPLLQIAKNGRLPSLSKMWDWAKLLISARRGGTRSVRSASVTQCRINPPDLLKLPFLTSWPLDGGPFATLPLVFTQSPETKVPNLGIYRLQRFDQNRLGLHMQIGKGGGFHLHQAEMQSKPLPVTVFFGGPAALTLSAIAPLPENISELLLASWLLQKPLDVTSIAGCPHPLFADCEFALVGHCPPHERELEGPFGDHFGYYSLAHPFPVFKCEQIYHRKKAIFPATIVGKPPQEDLFIGNFLQEAISPLIPLMMPGVRALWSYGAGGFHTLTSACVKERYEREAMAHAFRILGEGQLSLTKCLFLVDEFTQVRSLKGVLKHLLSRFHPETDCYIFPFMSMDTLDYNGPRLNRGSKMVFIGTGKAHRDLPYRLESPLPKIIKAAYPFCPGCLVIEAKDFHTKDAENILKTPSLINWPLIALVDDAKITTRDEESFIWNVFTRFDPAVDLFAQKSELRQNQILRSGPLLIDARSKGNLPPEVETDKITQDKVSRRWNQYFQTKII